MQQKTLQEDKLQRGERNNVFNNTRYLEKCETAHEKQKKKIQNTGPHYLKAPLRHILILMSDMSHHISQNVLLLQETHAATADNLRHGPWDPGWLSWGHYCTQSNPTHTDTRRVWWQTTVTLSSSIAGRSCWTSNTSHTAQWASAPLVSHCRHRGTARVLLQLCRTNTEISLSKKHVGKKKV